MIVTYIGHSCFSVEKDGYRIVFDPYEDGSVPGLTNVREEANMVICSHEHFDHNARGNVQIVDGGECPFEIMQIETYHDGEKGASRGSNTITVVDDGESKLAHFGDLGCDIGEDMDADDIELLKNLDVILVPVGGTYTINPKEAAELIEMLEPRIALPMHYRSNIFGFGFDNIAEENEFYDEAEAVAKLHDSVLDSEAKPFVRVNALRPRNMKPVK